jgi:hypothetical protein
LVGLAPTSLQNQPFAENSTRQWQPDVFFSFVVLFFIYLFIMFCLFTFYNNSFPFSDPNGKYQMPHVALLRRDFNTIPKLLTTTLKKLGAYPSSGLCFLYLFCILYLFVFELFFLLLSLSRVVQICL